MYEIGNGKGYLTGYFTGGEVLIENTKEQISAFIMATKDEQETVITNIHGDIEITTFGGFINICQKQAFVPVLQQVLVPQQLGEVDPIPFVPYKCPKN